MRSKFHLSIPIIALLIISVGGAFGQTALEQATTEATSEVASTLKEVDAINRIAILTLTNDSGHEVTDRLITAVVNSKKYQVIDRGQLEILLKEQNFQMTEVVDPETAKRAGKIAGVDAVMYGTVKRQVSQKNRGEIAMHVQMVNVQNGEIVYAKDIVRVYAPESSSLSIQTYVIIGLIAIAGVIVFVLILRGIFRKGDEVPAALTPQSSSGEHQTVEEVGNLLSVNQPQSITCKVNLKTRQATIGRIELRLKGEKAIPAGWRGKVAIVSGINRRYTLADSIPLPRIALNVSTPINPGEVSIPRDIAHSRDPWSLEFFIVDPRGGEALLFRSPSVSFV